MKTTTRSCDRCERPARPSDIELVQFFPMANLACLCDPCAAAEEAAEDAKLAEQQRKREAAAREARLEVIPPEMRRTDITRADFNPELWAKVQGWRPSSARWVGIIGTAGQCKTRCLALLAERLVMEGHRLQWTTAVEFQEQTDNMRSDERAIKNEAHEYFRACKRAAILVLDDVGKNTWTPTVERNLFSVIDHRKTHDLPVLWSANTHPLEILKSGELSKDRAGPLIGRILEASRILKA